VREKTVEMSSALRHRGVMAVIYLVLGYIWESSPLSFTHIILISLVYFHSIDRSIDQSIKQLIVQELENQNIVILHQVQEQTRCRCSMMPCCEDELFHKYGMQKLPHPISPILLLLLLVVIVVLTNSCFYTYH
jgi:hypothetical protein